MATQQTRVLLTGATGFIGGTVLAALLSSPDENVQKCKISVMVRGADKAKYYEAKGLTAIQFDDHEDVATLKKAASEHDVVISCVTGFATNTARALIQGLGERQRQTGRKTSYIHTSGTSNLGDYPISKKYTEPRYPDGAFRDTEDIDAHQRRREALERYPQRTTDVAVVDTGAAEAVATHILMPPTIWGRGAGAFNRRSMQVPSMCKAALAARRPVVLGPGAGRMDAVHVADLAALYELLLRRVLAGAPVASGAHGIFFCEAGHHTWLDIAHGIGRAGVAMGLLDSADVLHVDLDEAGQRLGGPVLTPAHIESGFGINSVTETTKVKEYGWQPKHSRDDFLESFRDELGVAHGDHD